MTPGSLTFSFPIGDFDLSKLPIDPALLNASPEMLREAISDYYADQFRAIGGEAHIAISEGVVNVRWISESGIDGLVEHGVELLRQGDFATAIPLLQSALARVPNNTAVLFNLGMALSDQRKIEEAIDMLERLVTLEPESARGWNALGVAQGRNNDIEQAEASLRRSLELAPQDGHAHRNLATLLLGHSPREAMAHYQRAAELLPDDPAAQYGYGRALLDLGDPDSADPVFRRVIEMAPLSEIAEMARSARRDIAHKTLLSAGGDSPRADATMYCLAAIQLFAESPDLRKQVTFEIALLGRSGLDINDPDSKYTLKSLPGKFSGLQLVSYMYVGMKELAPDSDPGIDLSREYGQARNLSAGR